MSYISALEAAGAKVIRYEYFSSYQGTILAEVEYEGKHGYVEIINVDLDDCKAYRGVAYTEQEIVSFGRKFLEEYFESAERLIEQTSPQLEWSYDAGDKIKWVLDEVDPARTELSRQKSLEKALNRKVAYNE